MRTKVQNTWQHCTLPLPVNGRLLHARELFDSVILCRFFSFVDFIAMTDLSATFCWICPFTVKGRQQPQIIYCKVQQRHSPIHRECCPGKGMVLYICFKDYCISHNFVYQFTSYFSDAV